MCVGALLGIDVAYPYTLEDVQSWDAAAAAKERPDGEEIGGDGGGGGGGGGGVAFNNLV